MAEIAIGIIRLKLSSLSDRQLINAQDFEICIKEEPSTFKTFGSTKQDYNITKRVTVGGHTVRSDVFKLPTISFEPISFNSVEDLIHDYFKRTGNIIRRVIRIPLHENHNQPTSSNQSIIIPGLSLVCVPVFLKESVEVANSRYENFQKIVNLCENQPELFDIHSKNMILILDKWLLNCQKFDANFISNFFMLDFCRKRIRQCAHNPAFIDQQEQCFRNLSISVRSNNSSTSADLDDRVHIANLVQLAMLNYNKITISVINPAFISNFSNLDPNYCYYYQGMKLTRNQRAISTTSRDSKHRISSIHKAAEDGNSDELQRLLNNGVDSNEKDEDNWTPLHYACFHGHLEVVNILLNSPQMISINAQNNGGATALHYAVINGNEYLVEILTSHASIDVNIQNHEGLRPIDYCSNNSKILEILKMQIFKTKINVDTVIGPFSIKSSSPKEAKVGEILKKLAEETHLNQQQINCFAIFVYSESICLQLRPDSLVEEKLKKDKWNSMIRKLINCNNICETPLLKLKRNAYATAKMEITTKIDKNSFGRATLLDEAINSYLSGHLITNSKNETTKMAAIVARKMRGFDYKPSSKNLANIFPQYILDNHDRSKLAEKLKAAIKANETKNNCQLEDDFMSMARGLITYGASFFDVDVFKKKTIESCQGLVGINDHGLHIILKSTWTVKNLKFDEFEPIYRDVNTVEIDAQRLKSFHMILVSTQMKFIKGILQKFRNSSLEN